LSGDPVDQTCGIQQRCCLIEELLDVESDFKAFLMKARTGAGIGCAPYSRALSSRLYARPEVTHGIPTLRCLALDLVRLLALDVRPLMSA
jgi:hypothetical protein